MLVLQIDMPAEYSVDDRYSSSTLDEDDLSKITEALGESPLFVVYWYGTGSYEGAGHMLFSTDGMRWHEMCLGHCSCHGPTDNYHYSPPQTLQDLEARYTEEAHRDVKPLFEAIRSHHWSKP
jgi:hypothetical protein